jgi:hypothetical protein
VLAACAAAVVGLASVSIVWRLRLTAFEVFALVGWLGLAILGHAHKIVPFIAWSVLRSRGVTTGVDGRPLLFAHLFHHPTARLTFVAAATGVAAALIGIATATAPFARAGGVLLAASGLLATANLAYGPLRISTERRNRVSVPDPRP